MLEISKRVKAHVLFDEKEEINNAWAVHLLWISLVYSPCDYSWSVFLCQSTKHSTMKPQLIIWFDDLNSWMNIMTTQEMKCICSPSWQTSVLMSSLHSTKLWKKGDKLEFMEAIKKEVEDHESYGHRFIVMHSTLSKGINLIKEIWSFKRK